MAISATSSPRLGRRVARRSRFSLRRQVPAAVAYPVLLLAAAAAVLYQVSQIGELAL